MSQHNNAVKESNINAKKLITRLYAMCGLSISFLSTCMAFRIQAENGINDSNIFLYLTILTGTVSSWLYWQLVKLYQANKLKVNTIKELIYSQFLSFSVMDFVLFIVLVACFRGISVNTFAKFLLIYFIQIASISICSLLAKRAWSQHDSPQKVTIIYGEGDCKSIASKMNCQPDQFEIINCMDADGSIEQLKKGINKADAVYLYKVESKIKKDLILLCKQENKDIYTSTDVEELITRGYEVSHALDTPFLTPCASQPGWTYFFVKRAFDIISSGTAIVLLSPVMALTALAIKAYDGGPALYSQNRLTKDRKVFKIYKFRSMITDAEKNGARLACQNDDRITPIGKVIRATRLDELPQLFNILMGDMSIVGPRPERPEIEEQYLEELPEFGLRLQVKAGLTGYAQVYGKYNTTPEDKLKLDLNYINQRSILEDFKLIVYTPRILLSSSSTEGISENKVTAGNN